MKKHENDDIMDTKWHLWKSENLEYQTMCTYSKYFGKSRYFAMYLYSIVIDIYYCNLRMCVLLKTVLVSIKNC